MRQAISAAWVVPIDGPPIKDGLVAWEDGVIVEVGEGVADRHHADALILPGIVNAHSHLEYAVYGGFADGEPFGEWIATHMRRKRLLSGEEMLAIARLGALDALSAGITTTADYSFSGASARAVVEFGLRAIVYLEVFGSDPAAAAERYHSLRDGLQETELVALGVSPHAPYTCSVGLYAWCRSLGVPVGTHLAENAAENEWLEHGTGPLSEHRSFLVEPTGKRSVATLEDVLDERVLCAHGVELTHDEIALLASADVPIAHCPRSNAALGCGIAPLGALRSAGVRVGLGTDSPASTPSPDPWEEMRAALYGARSLERRPDALSASEALRLATLDGARALGLDTRIGSLTPGKRADITVLSTSGTPYDPVEDPVVAAVLGGSTAGVRETIVDGSTRYRQGEQRQWPEVRNIASAARARMLA